MLLVLVLASATVALAEDTSSLYAPDEPVKMGFITSRFAHNRTDGLERRH